jgi:hypothetical protein
MHPDDLVLFVRTAALVVLVGCQGAVADRPDALDASPRTVAPAAGAGLRTLTPSQYQASVRAVLGLDAIGVEVPVEAVGQSTSVIAAARGGIAPATVVDYERAAHAAVEYVFADPARRAALSACSAVDDACREGVLATVGRRAFRRPLTETELSRYLALSDEVGVALDDPEQGLAYALAGLLQSPSFLYRVELGRPDPARAGYWMFDDYEMATRLAYLAWSSTPDDSLLDRAARGDLTSAEGIASTVDYVLADPRAHAGRRAFFDDLLHGQGIEEVEKDATLFPEMTASLRAAMREQMVATAELAASRGDMRSIFTTRTTFLDAELARLYGLEGDFGPDLTQIELGADSPRAGILGLPGVLAQHAYPGKTSPALRGLFVRSVFLCQTIPPPPPDIDTTIPEPLPGELVTTRDLVARHQEEPRCAACHARIDPIGLALENYDAIGRYRETQNDLPIDPSGDLDGVAFDGPASLGEALAVHPSLASCLMRTMFAFAAGRTLTSAEAAELAPAQSAFVASGHRMDEAVRAIATSEMFRTAEVGRP